MKYGFTVEQHVEHARFFVGCQIGLHGIVGEIKTAYNAAVEVVKTGDTLCKDYHGFLVELEADYFLKEPIPKTHYAYGQRNNIRNQVYKQAWFEMPLAGMPPYLGFDYEKHIEIGATLKEIQNGLQSFFCYTLQDYYTLTGPVVKAYKKVHWGIISLKSDLDNCVFREYPDKSTQELVGVYYHSGVLNRSDGRKEKT